MKKKRLRTIIILAAVLVLIGCAVAAVKIFTKEEEEVETVSEPVVGMEDIESLSYVFESSTITIEKNSDGTYTLKDEPDFPLNQTVAEEMFEQILTCSSDRDIDIPDDLSEYGLDEPVIEITVSDGENEKTLKIGSSNNTANLDYALLGGSDKISMLPSSVADAFKYLLSDLIEMDSMPEIETVKKISTDTYTVEHDTDSDGRYIIDGYYYFYDEVQTADDGTVTERSTALEGDAASSFMSTAAAITPEAVDMWSPNEAAISSRGFDEPETLTIDYVNEVETTDEEGETTTESVEASLEIRFGSVTEDGYYRYMMFEGSEMIYLVSVDTVDSILNPDVDSMLPVKVANVSFSDIESAELNIAGDAHSVDITRGDDETTLTFDGADASLVYVQSFLVDLADLEWEQVCYDADVTGCKAELSVSYTLEDSRTVNLTVYEYNSDFSLAVVDGRVEQMLINVKDVDAVLSSWEEMLTNLNY